MKHILIAATFIIFFVGNGAPLLAQPDTAEQKGALAVKVQDSLVAAKALFKAINERDLMAFETVLSTTRTPVVAFFWGEQVKGKDTLVQWHREWFEEKGWFLQNVELQQAHESENLAVLDFEVAFDKSETRKFRLLVSVVMVREQTDWKLARIQQTMLEGPST